MISEPADEGERTLRRRKEQARVEYLRSHFDARPVVSISARSVEGAYEELKGRTVGKGKDARPVAVATVNRYMKLLHAVLRLGVKRGLLLTNPASAIELARENNARNRCLSDAEETSLMKALPVWLRPLVTVAVHTGMRRGELLALRWDDVDLTSRQLRIRRDKAGDGRWVALNSVAINALLEAKRRKVTSSLVFCTPEGHSLSTNFKRYWQPAVSAAGLISFRFHDCRHTFASRLVNNGVDRYVVQAAGGWKTASMMQRYAHLEPSTIRAAVERLVQRPAGANGHQNGHQTPASSSVERLELPSTA